MIFAIRRIGVDLCLPNEFEASKLACNVEVVESIDDWPCTSAPPKLVQYAALVALRGPAAAEWMRDNYRNVEIDFVGYRGHYIQEGNA